MIYDELISSEGLKFRLAIPVLFLGDKNPFNPCHDVEL
jgi:hypothetical protein